MTWVLSLPGTFQCLTYPRGYFLFLGPFYSLVYYDSSILYSVQDWRPGGSALGWCLGVVGPGRKTPPPGVPGSCKMDDVAKGYADNAIIVLQEGIVLYCDTL